MSKPEDTKEGKLMCYIKKSFGEYHEGNKAQFNKILDEISNKGKSEDLLRLWLKAMILLVSENQKHKGLLLVFSKAVLSKTSWFHSENHLKVQDLFKKFLSILLSLFYELSDFVYKYLLSKVAEEESEEEEKKEENKIIIRSSEFKSPEELIKFIRTRILLCEKYTNKPENIVKLEAEDHEFMHEIFKHHKHYQEKFQGFSHLGVGDFVHGPKNEKTRCFFVVKTDKTKKPVDISYLKSIQFLMESLKAKGEVFSSENLKRIELIASIVTSLLKIYPLSRNVLIQLLNDTFPHKRSSEHTLQLYLAFLLSIATQNPKLLPEILSIALEKLIAIDVEIKLEDTVNFIEESSLNVYNDENAKKLDLLMSMMFHFIKTIITNNRTSIFENLTLFPEIDKLELFEPLLKIFQEKLLVIYQSKYSQFLMFFLASFKEKSQKFFEEFLSLLITNSLAENQAKIIRNNSISYLSSFLARAKFLSSEHLTKSVDFLIEFLENYELVEENLLENKKIKVLKSAKINREPENSHFLLILQGLLYVTCYHNTLCEKKSLVDKIIIILIKAQGFEGFKTISHEILQEFSKKTGNQFSEQIKQLDGILKEIDNNPKIELFFPFDPYLLKNSEGFIREIYRFWNDEMPEDRENIKGVDCEKETDSSSPFIGENSKKKPPNLNRKRKIQIRMEDEAQLIKKIKK